MRLWELKLSAATLSLAAFSTREGIAIMQITVTTANDHRVRTVQTAMSNTLGIDSQVDMLAPGGSTSSSSGSCCSCSTCAVVAQPGN